MKKLFLILSLILTGVTAMGGFTCAGGVNARAPAKIMSRSEIALRLAIGKPWELRATLSRNYIASALNDPKGADGARDKLLKNAGDLGASIQPYYGYLAGGRLTGLLKKDVAITGEVIKAARIGNIKDVDRAKKKWYANALVVAGFFAIPRNQTKKDLTDILYTHLDLTWGGIQAILEKDETKGLEYYEKDRAHMLMFSDVLVRGLIKQFPDKFKG